MREATGSIVKPMGGFRWNLFLGCGREARPSSRRDRFVATQRMLSCRLTVFYWQVAPDGAPDVPLNFSFEMRKMPKETKENPTERDAATARSGRVISFGEFRL